MQCCQPHSNPSFTLFFSTLHRLSSSLNILKCLPLLLPASEKWWIWNSDWLWRLVKNSLSLSHPPVKSVHFFPLTVTCLPSHPTLFSKTHNVRGPSVFSSPLFFNPFLTIHLSVLLHVQIGLIVCMCIFQRRGVWFADRVICLLLPHFTGQMSKHVAVCDWLYLTQRRHHRLQWPRKSRAGCIPYGNCTFQFGSSPVFHGWVSD